MTLPISCQKIPDQDSPTISAQWYLIQGGKFIKKSFVQFISRYTAVLLVALGFSWLFWSSYTRIWSLPSGAGHNRVQCHCLRFLELWLSDLLGFCSFCSLSSDILYRNSSQFGRTGAFYLRTGSSGRSVLRNGKRTS